MAYRIGQWPIVARWRVSDRGYSLPELMLTIGIIAIVSGIALFQFGSAQQAIKGDGGMRLLLAQMNTARELAISQRRTMQLQFTNPNTVQIVRQDVPTGTTVVGSMTFESGVQFYLTPGVPDSPDAFGKTKTIDFGTATTVSFSSDGTCVDQTGNPVNGTVFIAMPGQILSSRAVTVLGATGRVRGYRWDGSKWVGV
jgi:prepilin-type N-terminal cleavage/methylation domain-containing protein